MPDARKPGRPKDEALTLRRREEILEVATRLFAEQGFPKTDLQVVADELKIGKGTVYRYFPSKHDLFLAAVDRGMQRLLEKLHNDTLQIADPLAQIAQALRSYLAYFDDHPEFTELLIIERGEFRDRKNPTYFRHMEENSERWRDFFREMIRAGRVRDTSVDEILDGLNNLVYGTIFTNHFAGRKETFEVQSRRILNIAFLGILTDEERKRFMKGELS